MSAILKWDNGGLSHPALRDQPGYRPSLHTFALPAGHMHSSVAGEAFDPGSLAPLVKKFKESLQFNRRSFFKLSLPPHKAAGGH